MRYHGGKWLLAPWIISNFPEHRVYVEPFGGAGSVLLRKPRAYAEIYNDLDDEVVNVFEVARTAGDELLRQLRFTPFSRKEFEAAYMPTDDPIERARRTIIRSLMGFSSNAVTAQYTTGFRSNSTRSHTTPAHDWKTYAECFDFIIERLRGVVIENRDACEVMDAHDSHQTLHYVDPPYVFSSRGDSRKDYRHELTDDGHAELANYLRSLNGFVIISGYDSELYNELYDGFTKITKNAYADGAKKRVECLWLSPGTQINPTLF